MPQRARQKSEDKELHLLRNKAAPSWTVAVDEQAESEFWLLEIDSPQVYLTFQLPDTSALQRAADLLNSSLVIRMPNSKPKFSAKRDQVNLGCFGDSVVQLLRDNEDFPRCFIVVGPHARSTMRISLEEQDIRAFLEALHSVIEGIDEDELEYGASSGDPE